MDPNETLFDILDSLSTLSVEPASQCRAEAVEALRNLADWLERGGFAPTSIVDGDRAERDGYSFHIE